jgi:predicted ArsR family transcriptional regulator
MNQFARNTDPSTSWAAADSAKDLAAKHAKIIFEALRKHGAMGKDGIAQITGLDGSQVARRLSELERNHKILLTGRNVQSKAGRFEREWNVMSNTDETL